MEPPDGGYTGKQIDRELKRLRGERRAFSIGSDEASTMSMRLVALAGDFASFNNASIEDTLYAIGAALRGENEPIKKYIGNISQATIQSKALELGLYSGKGAIDANAKALAVYNIILDSSERQIGDAAKTSKNLAGQKRILTAQIKDLQAEIGQKLLPVVTDLVTKLNEAGMQILMKNGKRKKKREKRKLLLMQLVLPKLPQKLPLMLSQQRKNVLSFLKSKRKREKQLPQQLKPSSKSMTEWGKLGACKQVFRTQ